MSHLLVIAIAPAIALMYFFWLKDRYEPEPRNKIVLVMFLGALSVIPAIILETLGSRFADVAEEGVPPLIQLFVHTFIVIALVEELGKFVVVRLTLYRDPEFDEPYDGIVYCVAASLGFALLENVLYVLGNGVGVGILRALLAVPAHALFGVGMGYFVGQARFATSKAVETQLLMIGLAVATVMHGAYDFVLFSARPLLMLTVLPLMVFFWVFGLHLVKKGVALSPFKHARPAPAPADGPLPILLCASCQSSLVPGASFCMACGHAVARECPSCKRPLHAESLFCGHCGHQLGNASPAQ